MIFQYLREPVYDHIAAATADLTIAMLLGLAYRMVDAEHPDNHMIIEERECGLMKPAAYFINTARGRLVDEPALVRALQNKTIAGAGLDVFWHEPPRSPETAASPEFFTMDNVILAPHNGGATWHARGELAKATARQIAALIAGERPEGLVLD